MKYKYIALAGAAALIAAGAPAHINQTSTDAIADHTFDFSSARFAPAVQIEVSRLLSADVTSSDSFGHGRIHHLSFDDRGTPEWVWLEFGDYLNNWTVRAPVSDLYYDRQTGEVITRPELSDLKERARMDREAKPETATRLSAEFMPPARLMGVRVLNAQGDAYGRVHSVEVAEDGAVESIRIESGFGLLGLKQHVVSVPADKINYLPIMEKAVIEGPAAPQFAAAIPDTA